MARSFLLLPFLLLLSLDSVHACQCAESGPPCEAFWKADTVFTATVISKSRTKAGDEEALALAVRLSSEQVFRGDLGGREVEVVTGFGDSDCGYPFQTGKQYLVYATHWAKDNRLYTGICTRTRPLSEADEDLAYLRNLPRDNSAPKILVNVTKLTAPLDEGKFDLAPMPGLRITAERDNKRLEAKTDEKGNAEFTGVSPGKYNIRVYFSDDASDYLSDEANVGERGCSSVPILYQVDGDIEGKVVDATGQPVNGVKVDLIPIEDAASDSPKGKVRFTNSEGHYKLTDIPPGKYVLGINLIGGSNPHCPRERTYYVNPNHSVQAGYVELKEREQLKDYDIQLPRAGVEREIEGIVVFPDGKPAAHAAVNLTNGSGPGYVVGGQKGVDERGHFVLKGIEGCTYRVNAFTYGGRVNANSDVIEEQRHAEPVTITLTEQKPPLIKLVLSSPGFEHHDNEQKRPKN